jgi:hypothetical protein
MSRHMPRVVMAIALGIFCVWTTSGCGVDTDARGGKVGPPQTEGGTTSGAEKPASGDDAARGDSH